MGEEEEREDGEAYFLRSLERKKGRSAMDFMTR